MSPRRTTSLLPRAALALVAVLALTPAVAHGDTGGRLFGASSFWNTPLPANAPIDPANATIMGGFVTEIKREISAGTGPWIDTKGGVPIYTVGPDQPRVPVKLDTGSWGDSLRADLADGVPIPPGAQPGNNSDHHLTIYQPSTDTLWDFWEASLQSDGWHVQWGGVMRNVSTTPGYFQNLKTPAGAIFQQANWGATATSLPDAGGVIRVDEVRAGSIDHVLALDVPDACSGRWSWPAQRTDGTSTAANCIPEGARLRIDPTVNLSTISMPPFTRMLAVAAQRYGIVVRDKTYAATGFTCETPVGATGDLWLGTNGSNGLLGGYPWNLVQYQFPWGHLQLLKMDLRSSPDSTWATVSGATALPPIAPAPTSAAAAPSAPPRKGTPVRRRAATAARPPAKKPAAKKAARRKPAASRRARAARRARRAAHSRRHHRARRHRRHR